jgi:hypothetical protein
MRTGTVVSISIAGLALPVGTAIAAPAHDHPVHPGHPAQSTKYATPGHPAHPVHPAHPAHPTHPVHPSQSNALARSASQAIATQAAAPTLAAKPITTGGNGEVKVTLCHVQPGNPDNAETITVGAPAALAHLRNHPDYLGPCGSALGSRVSGAAAIRQVQNAVDANRDDREDAAAHKARPIVGSLPVTGLGLAGLVLAGLTLLGGGAFLRRAQHSSNFVSF